MFIVKFYFVFKHVLLKLEDGMRISQIYHLTKICSHFVITDIYILLLFSNSFLFAPKFITPPIQQFMIISSY